MRVGYVIIEGNDFSQVKKVFDAGVKALGDFDDEGYASSPLDEKYGSINRGLKKYDIIYGIGGGAIIDVAKYASYKLNLPFISIPTSLSNDGFASPFSVLNLGEDGVGSLRANVPVSLLYI